MSGLQLDVYEARAREWPHPVWLLTLASQPLRNGVANLTWNRLYQAARREQSEHRSWRDLRAFLEEQMVANDSMGPISDREAGSLEPAHELIQKVSAVVIAVHRKLPGLFPEPVATKLHWKNEGQLLNYIGAAFRTTGDLVGDSGLITYGLTTHEGTAYWIVNVRAGQAARATVERARSTADQAQLGAEWERPASGPSVLVARTRATALQSHEAALEWFEARLREVAASGVLQVLFPSAGVGPSAMDLTPSAP